MKKFKDTDRLDYSLPPGSIVMDIGAHEGWFTQQLLQKFPDVTIHAYEPMPRFYNQCVRKFDNEPRVKLWPFALGASDRCVSMGVKGDMTGEFCAEPNEIEEAPMRDIASVVRILGAVQIGLVVINCEGGEYELLERLIDEGLIERFDNIAVQFHTVGPNYEARRAAIFERLDKTHEHIYGEPFVWDGFTLRLHDSV